MAFPQSFLPGTAAAVSRRPAVLVEAIHQSLDEFLTVEALADEDEFVDPDFVLPPRFRSRAEVDLFVDALEDEFRVPLPLERQQSLGPVQVRGPRPQQVHHEHVEPLRVEVALEGDAHGLDDFQVVFGFALLRFEEIRIDTQDGFHVETIDSEDLIEGCLGAFRLDDGREAVDRCQPILQGVLLDGRHQVDLVQQDLVRERDLLVRFVHGAVRFHLVEVQGQVLRVGQAHDAVDVVVVAHLRVGLDRVHDGCRIGQSGRLQQDRLEVATAFHQLAQSPHEIAADRTADAAVVHRDEILGRIQRFGDLCLYRWMCCVVLCVVVVVVETPPKQPTKHENADETTTQGISGRR
jgi:hypothetical protein